MASILEILKPLFDDSDYHNNWARQYNPYSGGNGFWRGLGAINHMLDRNAADRARRNQQKAYKTSTNNADSNGANATGIGANSNGVYGVGQPITGIGANADGVYGVGQPNDNGVSTGSYDTGIAWNYPSVGLPNSSLEGIKTPDDNTMNITSLTIGKNYNGRIDGQVGGLGIPQAPQNGGDFASIFNSKNFNGGSLANPSTPSVSSGNSLAQGIEGQNNISARDLSRYLGDDYNIANWMMADVDRGVDNPYISALRYEAKIAPLVLAARENDVRNAFMTYNSGNSTPEQKMDALAKLAYYTKTPDLADRIQRGYDNDMYRRGYVRDNSDVGRNILSVFKDYEEGEQWMSPDGTGDSRTQCSNFVSDVLRKAGLNIGSPNGDELMKQFGKAYHTGLDGIQAGDVLNFKDHVGFYVGNGQYIARNSSGGVHQGSMEEAIKAFGQPLGYASVREYAAGVPRYTRDTSKESLLRQKHQYDMEKIAAQNAYRLGRDGKGNQKNKSVLSDRAMEEANAAFSAYNEYMGNEDIDDNIKGQAREKTVLRLSNLYKALIDENNGGMSPQQARSELRKLGESQKLAPHVITSILDEVESYGKNSKAEDGKDNKPSKTVGEKAAETALGGKKGLTKSSGEYDDYNGDGYYNIDGVKIQDMKNKNDEVDSVRRHGGYADIFGNSYSKELLAELTRDYMERMGLI